MICFKEMQLRLIQEEINITALRLLCLRTQFYLAYEGL